MASIDIVNVHKSYGSAHVLKGIDIQVDDGDFLVLVGPSGCGKSTLLNMIAGLEEISDGDIRIGDESMKDKRPSERDIAMVFQSYALYPNMTVAKNISFGLEMRNFSKAEIKERTESVSKMLQIEQLLARKPGQLSGGQRQRVAMGRALVREPKVFLFDEPLSNLDAKLRVDMRTEIKKLHQRLGATIVYVTHDQIEAMTLATKIAIMKAGELQQLGTPDQLYNQPSNLFVAGFMGSPSMNILPATIAEQGGKLFAKLSQKNTDDLLLPLPEQTGYRSYINKGVLLGIRPEAITDPESADKDSEHLYIADCIVNVTEPTGADLFAITELGGREVIARMRANTPLKSGETGPFAFNMNKAVLFDPSSEARID
jgi:multiple sugar transport system ATP-binding protein